MSPYRSLFSKKSPARTVRRNKSGRKDAQVNLGLMQLEPRLVMAPNVLAPETTAANPFGFPAGVLNLSGALAVSVLDTPAPRRFRSRWPVPPARRRWAIPPTLR